MMKTKKLTLAFIRPQFPGDRDSKPYKVIKVQHTTEFNPGDVLSKDQVDSLNSSRHWDVTVVAS